MDAIETFLKLIQRIYTDDVIAFLIFGAIFFLTYGRVALKRLSEGTVNESAHNLILNLFNAVVIAFLFGNLSFISNALFGTLSLPHLTPEFWETMPYAVTFIVALLALDFQNYWAHRILHSKYLWSVHALHHSDAHMTWTTTYRIHVLESVVMSLVYATLIGWLFLPPEIVAPVVFIRVWHSKLIHCQLGWTFGVFRKVIASPNYHRWHHSVAKEAHDKNFCDMFPMWDILFGTHHDPGLCETDIGLEDTPEGFLHGQLYPFKTALSAIKSRLPKRPSIQQQAP